MRRLVLVVFAIAVSMSGWTSTVPASARSTGAAQCALAANLTHVRHRIEGAIDQLQADTHYYEGHRLAAIDALSDARLELFAAEKYAVTTYDDSPACFPTNEASGGGDLPWSLPGATENRDTWGVRRWVSELTDQLRQDNRNYGGHRLAAIENLQVAQGELLACEQLFAHT
jgi:hypothetical protein